MGALSSPKRTVANRSNARRPRTLRLTSELITGMCEAIRAGVRPEIAAVMNGVPRRTFYEWMDKSRQPDARPLLLELFDSVELAVAEWEAADVLLIGKAARQENPGEWTAAAWRLERRLPKVYGKKTEIRQEISMDVIVDAPEWRALSERLLAALAPYPEALEAAVAEITGGTVVDGAATEVLEFDAA